MMNTFILIKNKDGNTELITPELDGICLPGITRQSVIDLVNDWGEIKVTERQIHIDEIVGLHKEGKVLEFFCSGTAANILPIKSINYKDQVLKFYEDNEAVREFPMKLSNEIIDIQYGVKEHRFQRRII
jgi:branched-chain amino acid aminotransferase